MTANENLRNTPKLIQVLQSTIESRLCELHTAMPARVISYNYDTNKAVVQPLLKRKYRNEEQAVSLPTISEVPVRFQRTSMGHLRFPISEGDFGQLIFNERSIDRWIQEGENVDPEDSRKHHLSDAVFCPGLFPDSKPIESGSEEDSIELKLNDSLIEIKEDGTFRITNGEEELICLIVETLGECINTLKELGKNDFTNTIFGPQQPINFSAYQALEQVFTTLKERTETLKG